MVDGIRSSIRRWLDSGARDWRLSVPATAGVCVLPVVVAAVAIAAGLIGKPAYKWITEEDGFYESLQVVAFGLSCLVALSLAARQKATGRRGSTWIFLGLALGFFFVTGEELSWGQRLLGLDTPDALLEANRQGELNVHNLWSVEQLFRWGKILVGAWGTVLPLVLLRRRGAERYPAPSPFTPHHTLVGFFVFPLVWGLYRELFPPPELFAWAVAEWAEVVEMNLALGLFLFMAFLRRTMEGEDPVAKATPERDAILRGAPAPLDLEAVFASLDREGVGYAWLRGGGECAASRHREVDLLVDPGHLDAFTEVVARYGFAPVASWGHAPHRFFVAYDAAAGVWWKLDVVTDLLYGRPIRALRGGDRARALASAGTDRRLAPEHALTGLLLHCLLDKERFEERHRRRLRHLVSRVRVAAGVAEANRWLAPALTWAEVSAAIETGGWDRLLARRGAVARGLYRREPLASAWRWASGRTARALRGPWSALSGRGSAIALLGPDGAGKTSLAQAMTEEKPLRARCIYMGTNPRSGTVGLPTTRWIRRRRETVSRPGLVLRAAGYLNRVFEQWLRAVVARYHRRRGRSVIFDRFVYDLYPERTNGRERPGRKVKRWLMRAGTPKPDLVVLLDAPGDVLYERKREHSPVRLEAQRRAYLELRSVLPQMVVVDATRDEETVRHAVTSLLWTHRTRAIRTSNGLD